MNATSRSGRLSSPGQVAAILVGSALTSIAVLAAIIALFVIVLIPGFQFGGKDQIPADLPIYPGAKLESAYASAIQGCRTVTATWSASAPATDVTDFYKSRLNAGSWTLTDAGTNRGDSYFYFESITGAHRVGAIVVSGETRGPAEITLDLATAI